MLNNSAIENLEYLICFIFMKFTGGFAKKYTFYTRIDNNFKGGSMKKHDLMIFCPNIYLLFIIIIRLLDFNIFSNIILSRNMGLFESVFGLIKNRSFFLVKLKKPLQE